MDLQATQAVMQGAASALRVPESPASSALEAARGFAETLAAAESQSVAALTTGADPHDLMTAIAESKLAVDAVVAVRDRAVEAYQEILRMPV
jgi:flagellar hook-basal body complex protein FliE